MTFLAKLLALLPFLSLLAVAAAQADDDSARTKSEISSNLGKCTSGIIPVSIAANNTVLNLDPPKDQQALTDFMLRWTSDPVSVNAVVVGDGKTALNRKTYKIWTMLCLPTKPDAKETVELLLHAGGSDHTHWTLGGAGSKYNYAEVALKAGHAVFLYDRLGVGRSEKPHGIKEVQTPTNMEVGYQLSRYLRAKPQGHEFKRVIAVGHSYGSATLTGLVNVYGNFVDATILTGLTSHFQSFLPGLSTWSHSIAANNDPKRLGSLGTEYTIWNNIINNQQNFFSYPNYELAILQTTESNKWGLTLGEMLTSGALPTGKYSNPMLVVTGDKDYLTCGGNCMQAVGNYSNFVDATKELFSGIPAEKFSTYIPLKTGHNINAHLTTPETYSQIQKWIANLA